MVHTGAIDRGLKNLLEDIRVSQATLEKQQAEMNLRLTDWMGRQQPFIGRRSPCGIKHSVSNLTSTRSTRSFVSQTSNGTDTPGKQNKLPESVSQPVFRISNHIQNCDPRLDEQKLENPVELVHKEATELTQFQSEQSQRSRSSAGTLWRPRTRLQHFVASTWFTAFFSAMIVCNAITIGAEVDYRTTHLEPDLFYKLMQYIFFVLFGLELMLRMVAFKGRFFAGRDATWNLFDAALVGLSVFEILETIISSSANSNRNTGLGRVFRVVRMARLVRIFRVLRFSAQLRLMLFMIIESIKSLGWLVCVLLSFLYLFSVIFTMGSIEYLGVPGTDGYHPERKFADGMNDRFGSVARSLYTCFQSMSGGLNWGDAMKPLIDMEMGWFYVSAFLFFIVFSVLCFMNVVTGVFVDGALEKSKNDRDMVIEKHINQKKADIENLKGIFMDGDEDESGTISKEEFIKYLGERKVQAYFASLKVDTSDIGALYNLLDRDGSGEIELDEFIDQLMHLIRAQSPEQYVQKLLTETKAIEKSLINFMHYVSVMFDSVQISLKAMSQATLVPNKVLLYM